MAEVDKMNTLKVEMFNIKDLKPYKHNPRKNDGAVDKVAASIKEFGFKNPIIVDENMEIIAGHTRYKAAKKLKINVVPVIMATDLTEQQVKAFRIADNKTSEFAEWDMDLVNMELGELIAADYDISVTGFDLDDMKDKTEVVEDDFDTDEALKDIVEPITKRGDVWQIGKHRLMCGDSTVVTDVERLMGRNKADMVFTDPPYGINIVSNGKVGGDNLAKCGVYNSVIGDETTKTTEDFYNTCISMGFDKFIIWGGNYFTQFLPFSESWIVWDKRGEVASNNFADGEMAWCNFKTPIRIYKQLWMGMIREGEHEKRVHPTQKPIKLLSDILNDFTKENNIIIDLFGGSGSTLIACEQTNRICYMMELDEKYCDVIIKRYETLTGNKAELIKG